MSDEPKNNWDAPSSGSLRRSLQRVLVLEVRSAAWGWGLVALPFLLLYAGSMIFKEADETPGNVEGLWVAVGVWSLAVFLDACALLVVYGFGVPAASRPAIVTPAVLGIVLNALLLMYCIGLLTEHTDRVSSLRRQAEVLSATYR
ncbi:MAG TPA: hypothetical protein VG055_12720 [Planctomycetaceae bacterium]|jgi:hypothetical protein|nr:hypothetical protein [Planctomycetaceae bacterium]